MARDLMQIARKVLARLPKKTSVKDAAEAVRREFQKGSNVQYVCKPIITDMRGGYYIYSVRDGSMYSHRIDKDDNGKFSVSIYNG